MPLLEAFLALALTMLSLAMIATLAVEFVHRLAGTRAKNLEAMLGEFYDSELAKYVAAAPNEGGNPQDHKTVFIKNLLTNPLLREGVKAGPILSSLKELTSLSAVDLFKKLAHTEIGKQIKAKAEAEIDETVDSLSRSYEALEIAATDMFKRKAQVFSLVAGIVVAIGLNANALLIFESYVDNPQARMKAIAQTDAALESFKIRTENTEGFRNKTEIVDYVKSIRTGMQELEDSGITIGYSPDKMPLSWPKKSAFPKWLECVFWALGVFGTGLLIGLGGPFWFNVVCKLTEVLELARGRVPTAADAGPTTVVSSDPMKSNKDAFKLAGGLPPQVKAQANLAAAARAAMDADMAVKSAADALIGTQEAAKNGGDNAAAVTVAKKSLELAASEQSQMYALKAAALDHVNSLRN